MLAFGVDEMPAAVGVSDDVAVRCRAMSIKRPIFTLCKRSSSGEDVQSAVTNLHKKRFETPTEFEEKDSESDKQANTLLKCIGDETVAELTKIVRKGVDKADGRERVLAKGEKRKAAPPVAAKPPKRVVAARTGAAARAPT